MTCTPETASVRPGHALHAEKTFSFFLAPIDDRRPTTVAALRQPIAGRSGGVGESVGESRSRGAIRRRSHDERKPAFPKENVDRSASARDEDGVSAFVMRRSRVQSTPAALKKSTRNRSNARRPFGRRFYWRPLFLIPPSVQSEFFEQFLHRNPDFSGFSAAQKKGIHHRKIARAEPPT